MSWRARLLDDGCVQLYRPMQMGGEEVSRLSKTEEMQLRMDLLDINTERRRLAKQMRKA